MPRVSTKFVAQIQFTDASALVEMEKYLQKRHSVTKLIVHLVFTTKYRRKVMNAQVLATVIDTVRETAIKIGCEPT